ncbi:MAG: DNA mismatch repair protein MutS [Planctomycetota bacterium]|jgi:DNA mismatch repair protein MutS|nr:DNA mismatch repair protein MutS [Planctomycetota bacterium]
MSQDTPLMRQYHQMKAQAGEAVLFFRMGDFYEMFHEDAEISARALGIALTSRSKNADAIPMAGIPVKALDGYLARMIRQGYSVAICEQVEDPAQARGIVRRDIVRIVTPGTLTEDSVLEADRSNFLLALSPTGSLIGAAWVDLSTANFRCTEIPATELSSLLARLSPGEILLPENPPEALLDEVIHCGGPLTRRAEPLFGKTSGLKRLTRHFETHSLAAFGLEHAGPALGAAGAVLEYLSETQKDSIPHIQDLKWESTQNTMRLDRATISTLELVRSMRGEDRRGTLFQILDKTRTPMGARLLREWILSPLVELESIRKRQGGVAELVEDARRQESLYQSLSRIHDIERLSSRIATRRASPRDLASLRLSLEALPGVESNLEGSNSPELRSIHESFDLLEDLHQFLTQALVDTPPATLAEGGVIRDGFDEELDRLRGLAAGGRQWLLDLERRESEETGIDSLRIGYNKVFGYYLEVTNTHRDKVPDRYIRKQTLKNAERYITPELKEHETEVLTAQDCSMSREREIFESIRQPVFDCLPRLLNAAARIARIDVLVSLARVAVERRYNRPEIRSDRSLEIHGGRHPVIEASLEGSFVPNDLDLEESSHVIILTGPNMAGKSTYIRQNALLVLMAQLGSFVPADSMSLGLVDGIFTRIGSSDEIARGRSTFMVEMEETASILRHATSKSLVVLDEVGRGTSTFDGVSIAWAITEHLHDTLKARTLFATHYHELTEMALILPGIKNANVSVKEWDDRVIFLHKIISGAADKSYGIHVARLAGVPPQVTRRSSEILQSLEDQAFDLTGRPKRARGTPTGPPQTPGSVQLSLFSGVYEKIPDMLRALDIESMTPVEALLKLQELKREVE